MKMDESAFLKWRDSASEEEIKLHDMLYDFGDYFLDMLFEPESAVGSWIKCQVSLGKGNWQDDVVSRPDELEYFSYSFFTTKVETLKGGYCGYYNKEQQLLCISAESLGNKSIILHEMLHLHETLLEGLPLFYHDTLLWVLYINLRDKINNLDDLVSGYAHILNEQSIYNKGGLHDILFLLKSFDLDIQMGYQLGTVFGYDMKELFRDYTYNVEK